MARFLEALGSLTLVLEKIDIAFRRKTLRSGGYLGGYLGGKPYVQEVILQILQLAELTESTISVLMVLAVIPEPLKIIKGKVSKIFPTRYNNVMLHSKCGGLFFVARIGDRVFSLISKSN